MQRRMVSIPLSHLLTTFTPCMCPRLTGHAPQLSKEDEVAAGEENEVRREDQEKINRFSRLHQRQTVLEEQLKAKLVYCPIPLCTYMRDEKRRRTV